ncbi:MAG: helix-turn-helix domain-containing protein, partial [Bacteroidota bacterium]
MVEKITPRKNEVIFILKNTMFHLLEGTGGVEIDFTPLHQWQDKLIFLERGQYIKFLSDDFTVRKITFEDETILQHQDFRVLFKHLVSTGYIHFDECTDCQNYLESSILSQPGMILDVSARQWFWQNPFQAKKEEYHLIFDVKEVIDREFKNNLGTQAIVELLGEYDLNPQQLMTEKLGITIKAMQSRKLLAEAKKEITFTEKSMKEIAFEYGFKDPAYFNRFFRSKTGLTPLGFRDQQTHRPEDSFIEDIYELFTKHH